MPNDTNAPDPAQPKTNGHSTTFGAGVDQHEWSSATPNSKKATASTFRPPAIIEAENLLSTKAPPRRWLVPHWIPQNDVTLLTGDGGIGKTTIALQLANACRYSVVPWLDMPVVPGPVLYVSAEEPLDELHFRMEQVTAGRKEQAHPKQLGLVSLCDGDAVLGRVNQNGDVEGTHLYNWIGCTVDERKCKLLVIEAAADVFAGNESNRWEVAGFIRLLRRISAQTDCAILLLAHPSVEGMRTGRGTSGSTQWNNAVRSRMYFAIPKTDKDVELDPDLRLLSLDKANRARTGEKITLKWNNGLFVPVEFSSSDLMVRRAEAKAVFMGLMRKFAAHGRKCGPSPSATYAPALFAKEEEARASRIDRKTLTAAMSALLDEGKIAVADGGRGTKVLVLVDGLQTP